MTVLANFLRGFTRFIFPKLALIYMLRHLSMFWFYLRKIKPWKQKLLNNTCTCSILFQRKFILTKRIFILAALAKPLLKIGTIFIKAMLLHFFQISFVQIFMTFGESLPFRPDVACKAEVHVCCHCLSQAPVEDRYHTHKSNVAPLHIFRLNTNFHVN
jgi:hypothetical protein